MSRFPRLIGAFAVAVLLAACGQAADSPVGPAGPSLDGGVLIGGSNHSDSTTTTPPPGDATTTEAEGTPISGGN